MIIKSIIQVPMSVAENGKTITINKKVITDIEVCCSIKQAFIYLK